MVSYTRHYQLLGSRHLQTRCTDQYFLPEKQDWFSVDYQCKVKGVRVSNTSKGCELYYLWNDASLAFFLFTHHGIGLPSSSLPISKDAHIVALEGMQQHLLPDIIIHTALRCKARIFSL